MFKKHLTSDKQKNSLIARQNILAMLRKGNLLTQITTSVNNAAIETRERNQRVLKNCFSTIYFIAKKKWALKKNFEDAMNHICDLGNTDLQIHFQLMTKNATYMSHFTAN